MSTTTEQAEGDRRDDDPRIELAGLARGLAAHLRRQDRLGWKRIGGPPAPASARPSTARASEPPESKEREVLIPRRTPGAGAPLVRQPRPPAGPLPTATADSGREQRQEPLAAGVAELAAANRAAAAACADLETLRAAVAGCTACGLCETRTQTVFADGSGRAGVMFIGEGPGFHEDQAGVPFVGLAGGLLTDIITKGMGLPREDVYIANVVKCRPPDNRDPSPTEKAICTPWLDRQIELLDPRVLIPLGRHAAGHLLGSGASMGAMRGRVHPVGGRQVVPTYHPAYLLRSPGQKKECWADIQRAMQALGLPIPERRDPERRGQEQAGDATGRAEP